MSRDQQKVVQYLEEAQATERALIRVLQSQIAMTPRGSYRTAIETHLRETRQHADRVGRRLQQLGHGGNPLMAALGVAETVAGQALALGKAPFDLLRGAGGAEKVLKNAKDTSATEALEIATYTAIERLARDVGDVETAELAASIRADEERMLARVVREIPKLTDAMLGRRYDVSKTGAADAVRKTSRAAKRQARQARKVPGVTRAEGQLKGVVASADDLAIPRYDELTADEILSRLAELSQIELGRLDSYERRNQNRATVLSRIETLRADEPWPGYDELTAAEVQAVLGEGDDARAREVLGYERAHKNRAGVMRAAERERSTA
jgi:ferritin-like metal-binding protein YciE